MGGQKGTGGVAFLLRDAGMGGAERSSLRLAYGMARRGKRVSVFFLKAKGPLLPLDPSIEVVDLKGSFLRFLRELQDRRPLFLLPVYTAMRALMARFLLRRRFQVIVSQRNMFTLDRDPIQTRLRFIRCRLLYPLASACVSISRGVADEMRILGLLPPDRIRVIYNPVVTEELLQQAKEPVDHPWLAPGEPPVILGVGRLGTQKDFATLIKAFALLESDARLVILGEGKQRRMLETLVRELGLQDRVLLPGYVVNPYAWMSRSALFASTSLFEGFGNVVAEALACGCNVVATDCPSGPAEILEGGRWGHLASPGDPEDVARALDEALRAPMPPNLLRKRANYFSEDRAVSEWLALLDELAEMHKNTPGP
ncbi:MAG: glycosyltransferase [Fretibacterium sp.]|nr:glycosyltransferase [Fretibacterium sp.]